MAQFQTSVIIPSYNRESDLLRALDSLRGQSLPAARFEVVVVDDGSSYDPTKILGEPFPFAFRYLRKENAGATVARNFGVSVSAGEVLVFMDDDVTASPAALEILTAACLATDRTLALANLVTRVPDGAPVYARMMAQADEGRTTGETPFTACNTQMLAVRRVDFEALGGLQDPTGGWPNWDDVDFGYRAHLAGYRLLRCGEAVAYHWDRSLEDLRKSCERWYRAAKSAVRLLKRHPGLEPHLPMFRDKLPIRRGVDGPALILRKVIRPISSARPMIRLLEHLAARLEKYSFLRGMLGVVYRWIIGGYIFRGFAAGLREEGNL